MATTPLSLNEPTTPAVCDLHKRPLVKIDETTSTCSWGSLGCVVKA